jgi:hypothetical protein
MIHDGDSAQFRQTDSAVQSTQGQGTRYLPSQVLEQRHKGERKGALVKESSGIDEPKRAV